jgi:hypothetical protein
MGHGLRLLRAACFAGHDLRPGSKADTWSVRTEAVTNLVCFDPESTSFGTKIWIHGTLAVRSADYRIELYDVTNTLLKTVTGHTDEGVIDATWPCTMADGQVRNDREFKADVFIAPTMPVEGRAASKASPGPARYRLGFWRRAAGRRPSS